MKRRERKQRWRKPHAQTAALTERETTILTLLADGMSTTEAASELGIQRSSVQSYVERLRRKLGASTTPHAIALAYHKHILLAPARDSAAA